MPKSSKKEKYRHCTTLGQHRNLCIMSKHYKELKTAKTTNENGFIWDKISDKHCEKYPYSSR